MKGRKDLDRLKLYSDFWKGRLQPKYPGILPIEVENNISDRVYKTSGFRP